MKICLEYFGGYDECFPKECLRRGILEVCFKGLLSEMYSFSAAIQFDFLKVKIVWEVFIAKTYIFAQKLLHCRHL